MRSRYTVAFLSAIGLISIVINVLYLTGSLFMLEVYDRVLPSRSVPTLAVLGVLALMLFAFQGALEFLRSRIVTRISAAVHQALAPQVFRAVVQLANRGGSVDALQPIRDLDQIRSFLGNGGPLAFADLPWMPVYVAICFLFHPWVGWLSLISCVVFVCIAWVTAVSVKKPTEAATRETARRHMFGEAGRRNASVLHALGMTGRFSLIWQQMSREAVLQTTRATDVALGFSSLTKTTRTALQSATLGLGAYLVIQQEASGGIMIASSILVARALSPVEQAVAQWKNLAAARASWRRLEKTLSQVAETKPGMSLPAPRTSLMVENVSVNVPGLNRTTVHEMSFRLQAGDALAIMGRSAVGKSTLARALVGVWPVSRGRISLDGAALDQWSPEDLGRHIGYLPQDVELFAGTVAENIARFTPRAESAAILEAAQAAGVHEMIVRLPEGYETPVGENGVLLSAGQRQRIGLARALFGNPFLVVLDEPNANLDAEGDAALTKAIVGIRQRGGIAIVVAHRPSAIVSCDLVMIMEAGNMIFGPKDQIISRPAIVKEEQITPPNRAIGERSRSRQ
jgi:ATP-binding cassette subfamily C protein